MAGTGSRGGKLDLFGSGIGGGAVDLHFGGNFSGRVTFAPIVQDVFDFGICFVIQFYVFKPSCVYL